jgi:hypothetical protein
MSSHHEFYVARAAEARADAAAATLDNVRDRCLRSEAAWSAMAARAERSDKAREKIIIEKASAASMATVGAMPLSKS